MILLALGMSMDAFAVSIGKGLALKRATVRDAAIIGIWFGVFHGVMPFIGYALGESVYEHIRMFDHWIIFGVLAYIAVSLIRDALSGEEHTVDRETSPKSMLPLSFAVSLDALAGGLAFSAQRIDITLGAVNLGILAGLLSFAGVYLGNRIGSKYGKISSIAGAAILLVIGIMALYDGITNA